MVELDVTSKMFAGLWSSFIAFELVCLHGLPKLAKRFNSYQTLSCLFVLATGSVA